MKAVIKILPLQKRHDGLYFLILLFPSENDLLAGDLPGAFLKKEAYDKKSLATIAQRVLEEQIGTTVVDKQIFLITEWSMAGRPSEYLYGVLLDNEAAHLNMKEGDDFRWISLNEEVAINFPQKNLIISNKNRIQQLVKARLNNFE